MFIAVAENLLPGVHRLVGALDSGGAAPLTFAQKAAES